MVWLGFLLLRTTLRVDKGCRPSSSCYSSSELIRLRKALSRLKNAFNDNGNHFHQMKSFERYNAFNIISFSLSLSFSYWIAENCRSASKNMLSKMLFTTMCMLIEYFWENWNLMLGPLSPNEIPFTVRSRSVIFISIAQIFKYIWRLHWYNNVQ